MMNLVDLSGRRILVVGASSGIGRAVAVLLSRLGAVSFCAARREEMLKETLGLLEGEGHRYYKLDVEQSDAIEIQVKRIVEENGPLNGLVYCADITGARPLSMTRFVDFDKVLKVNLYGFVEIVRSCSKKGRFCQGMSIVGVSSVASVIGNKGGIAYSASKAGMDAVVRCLAKELAKKKIRINTVLPGNVDTEMLYARRQIDKQIRIENQARTQRQYLGDIQPEDIAAAIVFLLSEASGFMTGIRLPVDGGFLSNGSV